MPVFGTSRLPLQRRRRHRAVPAPARPARRAGAAGRPGRAADGRRTRTSTGLDSDRARRRGCATWPRWPRRCAATTRPPTAEQAAGGRAGASSSHDRRRCSATAAADRGRVGEAARGADADARRRGPRRCSRPGRPRSSRTRATSWSSSVRGRELRTAADAETLSGTRSPASRCPRTHRPRRAAARSCAARTCPGRFPFTAGVFPFKRDDEDPARMFAGEGDAVPHQPAVPPARRGPAGDPAVDRVRLGDALRLRPRRAPDIYGKVGTSGVSHRHPRRHEGALRRLRPRAHPTTSVSMTINGPGARRSWPCSSTPRSTSSWTRSSAEQGREPDAAEAAGDPGVGAGQRPRHRPGRHPQGGPGPEHLHLLHRVRAAMMADIQEWFVEHEVRNFYSVSISGYHIAEAGANPITQLAFTLANGFTYVEAYLARGMADRRLRAQPLVLLLQRDGPGVHRARPGGPADLGRRHARAVRRRRALAEAEVPRADVGPVAARAGDGVQRHPHHAAGPVRDLRQLQQPAHQRLRRGRHHAERASRCGGRWPSR